MQVNMLGYFFFTFSFIFLYRIKAYGTRAKFWLLEVLFKFCLFPRKFFSKYQKINIAYKTFHQKVTIHTCIKSSISTKKHQILWRNPTLTNSPRLISKWDLMKEWFISQIKSTTPSKHFNLIDRTSPQFSSSGPTTQ